MFTTCLYKSLAQWPAAYSLSKHTKELRCAILIIHYIHRNPRWCHRCLCNLVFVKIRANAKIHENIPALYCCCQCMKNHDAGGFSAHGVSNMEKIVVGSHHCENEFKSKKSMSKVKPCNHATTYQNWARISPMLPALGPMGSVPACLQGMDLVNEHIMGILSDSVW